MGTLLATRFKNRRIALKLSQAEVAEGICKQARISKIERGNYSPGAELLYKLAKKMKVNVEYFFDESVVEESKGQGLEKFREMSRKLLDQRDYEGLEYIYDLEISKNNKLALDDKIYLSWIESLVIFFKEGNKDKGIEKLELLLKQVSEKDELYLTIYNSLLSFLFENGDIEEYKKRYEEVCKVFNKMKITTLEEIYILLKFRHNYCRFLWLNKENQKAIQEILDTIEICRKHKVYYALGDLYCLLGNVSESFKEKEEVKAYYQKSLLYLKEDNNDKLAMQVEEYIKENFS